MKKHIAFLHTAAVHADTFARLMSALDSNVRVEHFVNEALLVQAQRHGSNHPLLIKHVNAAMTAAASNGASMVVCTCSTIGGVAERTSTNGQFVAVRIDRAMADKAVNSGPKILVVAALESTLGPTTDLLKESASASGVQVEIEHLWVQAAWPLFLKGDHSSFIDTVVSAVQAVHRSSEFVIVLAQASMAKAEIALKDLGIDTLSSPRLGVENLVASLQIPSSSNMNEHLTHQVILSE